MNNFIDVFGQFSISVDSFCAYAWEGFTYKFQQKSSVILIKKIRGENMKFCYYWTTFYENHVLKQVFKI